MGEETEKEEKHHAVEWIRLEMTPHVREKNPGKHGRKDDYKQQHVINTKHQITPDSAQERSKETIHL
jgi:hypothetical protein